jgi:DNA-binding NtrC family response regulator
MQQPENMDFLSIDNNSKGKKKKSSDFLIWQPSILMAITEQVETISKRDCSVIIKGQTGTSKENLARQIHAHSTRADKPFIPVNCDALKGKILETQLFGQIFVDGPIENTLSLGTFRAADGGTVFLDDIDKLAVEMQVKVLHAIKDRYIQPVGTSKNYQVNVRIICATTIDLRQAVQNSEFLPDLYFTLNVATLELPPLSKQPDDIAILARHFLNMHAEMYNEPIKELTDSAEKALRRYSWPGNVRELSSVMERAFVMSSSDKIDLNDLPQEIITADIVPLTDTEENFPGLDEMGRELIIRALEKTRGQKMAAAELLKIDHRKLNRLMTKYNIELTQFKEN